MELILLLTLGLLATVIVAWVAYFRLGALERRLEDVTKELRRLDGRTERPAWTPPRQPAPAPEPPAPPPAPVVTPVQAAAAPAPVVAPQPELVARSAPPIAVPERSPPSPPPPQRSLEELLTTRLFVWVAGVALALGGAFLVRQVWGQPWFGPPARVGTALVLGAAMIGGGASTRLRSQPLIGAMLVAAGLVTMFAATFAGRAVYYLYSAPIAFIALAAIAGGGALLGLRHGLPISALSIVGAFAVPVLVRGEQANPTVLFTYIAAVTMLGIALTVTRAWRTMAGLTVIGAVVWPVLFLIADGKPLWPVAAYIALLGAVGAAVAWRDAKLPLVRQEISESAATPAMLVGAPLGALAPMAFQWLVVQSQAAPWALALAAVGAAGALVAARARTGFVYWPWMAAIAAVGALLLWPGADDLFRRQTFIAFAFTLGIGGYLGGLIAARGAATPAAFAYVIAGAPLGAMAACWWRLEGVSDAQWAIVGVTLAAALLLAMEIFGRPKPREHAQSVLAVGAAVAGAVAVALSLHGVSAALGYAFAALIAAVVHQRWRFTLVALAGGLLAARALLSLVWSLPRVEPLFGAPADFAILIAYGGTTALLLAGALLQRAAGRTPDTPAAGAYEATALGAAMIGLTLLLRLAIRGSLDAPEFDLLEAATYVTAWLCAALALRLSGLTRAGIVLRWAERIIAAAAVFVFVFFCCLGFNPVIGFAPRPVEGWPIFNTLLLAYGAPGVLAAVYAWRLKKTGSRVARILTVVAALALPLWATFETRRAFRGPELASTIVSNPEIWAYSVVWLIAGAVLLTLGLVLKRSELRWSALALIGITALKVFLVDMAGLAGAWRALSFLGLGFALLALAAFYQRRILPGLTPRKTDL